jgi:type I restriction enzyme R subunit
LSKKRLSEQDICYRYITPAIEKAGWVKSQIRMEYSFTDGPVIVRGKVVTRGTGKRADYILSYKPNMPLAVVEVKDKKHYIGDGIWNSANYSKEY